MIEINFTDARYSSIVEIGEMVLAKEQLTGEKYLKLHRGVMDVTNIDLQGVVNNIDFNSKKIQQYSQNDGDPELVSSIRENYGVSDHRILITPGGMASLDLIINSLSNTLFWIPEYHWGSWNKILKIHHKEMRVFDDFHLNNFRPDEGVVMLCYPSNPTGFIPTKEDLCDFIDHCESTGVVVILDIPYYYLFSSFGDISSIFTNNVIISSSFSKSIGLSGLRVGYVATLNDDLYQIMRIRSLYKYNSVSTVSQQIIKNLLSTEDGQKSIKEYQEKTRNCIESNIKYLADNQMLFSKYPSTPIGPFAVIQVDFETLLKSKISSVPLDRFQLKRDDRYSTRRSSRISVAVPTPEFKEYFDRVMQNAEST